MAYDVIHPVAVKDVDHLRNLGLDRITSQRVVVNIETSIVYDSRYENELPILLADSHEKASGRKKRSERGERVPRRRR